MEVMGAVMLELNNGSFLFLQEAFFVSKIFRTLEKNNLHISILKPVETKSG